MTDNSSHSGILFMTSDETWQAYNDWGGYNSYTGNATGSPWCCSGLDPGSLLGQVTFTNESASGWQEAGCLKGGVVGVVVPAGQYVRFAGHHGFRRTSARPRIRNRRGSWRTWSAMPSGT